MRQHPWEYEGDPGGIAGSAGGTERSSEGIVRSAAGTERSSEGTARSAAGIAHSAAARRSSTLRAPAAAAPLTLPLPPAGGGLSPLATDVFQG